MTTFPKMDFQQSSLQDFKLNASGCAYLHDRGINKFHSTLLSAYAVYSECHVSPKTTLANNTQKEKSQISRFLSSSNNMTIGTFSLLLGAMGKELTYELKPLTQYTECLNRHYFYDPIGEVENIDMNDLKNHDMHYAASETFEGQTIEVIEVKSFDCE